MNSVPKPFASLSSGLLARKGAARPAMRPQGFGQIGAAPEDLGWNDMGFEPPRPAVTAVRDDDHDAFGRVLSEPPLRNPLAALTPASSPVHDQRAELVERLAEVPAEPAPAEPPQLESPVVPIAAARARRETPAAAPAVKAKAAFTLRLEAQRHLRLRLASAVSGRSAQQLMTDALDELLASMPDLDSLAQQAPGAARRTPRKG